MSEAKFTPGSWKWRGDTKDTYEWQLKGLDGPDNEDVISLEDIYPGYSECGQDLRMIVSAANARLIAASPDMYAALEAVQALFAPESGVYVACKGEWSKEAHNRADATFVQVAAALRAAGEGK